MLLLFINDFNQFLSSACNFSSIPILLGCSLPEKFPPSVFGGGKGIHGKSSAAVSGPQVTNFTVWAAAMTPQEETNGLCFHCAEQDAGGFTTQLVKGVGRGGGVGVVSFVPIAWRVEGRLR